MQAAKWAGVGVWTFDEASNERQAEVVAGYLTENRLESVASHYARKDANSGGVAIPQVEDEE